MIETPLGDIPVQLYPNMAPQTVANFRAYADSGDWDGSLVHRSVPGLVIQEPSTDALRVAGAIALALLARRGDRD